MVTPLSLSDADRARIADAVARAEAGTAGEIVTIVARRSHDYGDVAWAWAGVIALTALLAYTALPALYLRVLDVVTGGWWPQDTPGAYLHLLFPLVLIKFAATRLILEWRALRLIVTPRIIKRHRVHDRAVELFRVAADQRTTGATGIIIYVSAEERQAQIIADRGIAEHVAPDAWGEAMAAMLDEVRHGDVAGGMVAAIGKVGVLLAVHCPRQPNDVNELPDRVIQL